MASSCKGPGSCDYGSDHDELGTSLSCPNGDCLEHHGDVCYRAEDIAAKQCPSTVVLWSKQHRCSLEHNHAALFHYKPKFGSWQQDRIWLDRGVLRGRYPRLLAAVQYAIIGTEAEALTAIEGHRNGHGGSEAVQHYGGPRAAIAGGIRCRRFLREHHPEYLRRYLAECS